MGDRKLAVTTEVKHWIPSKLTVLSCPFTSLQSPVFIRFPVEKKNRIKVDRTGRQGVKEKSNSFFISIISRNAIEFNNI